MPECISQEYRLDVHRTLTIRSHPMIVLRIGIPDYFVSGYISRVTP